VLHGFAGARRLLVIDLAALPGVVARELLLARTDDAAVAVTGLLAYPAGFEFTLSAVLRQLRFLIHRRPAGRL
jgi:hypothetical protein